MKKIKYLNIGNNIRIKRADDRNVEVEVKRLIKSHPNAHQKVYKETEKWVFGGFYQSVYQAAAKIVDEKSAYVVDEGHIQDLKDLMVCIEDAKSEIISAVKNVGISVEDFENTNGKRGRKKSVSVKVAEINDDVVTQQETVNV